jgi:GT2 family glycosyltransferase
VGVSIICPVLNGCEMTASLLGCLFASDLPEEREILIIDNGSSDETKHTDKIVGMPEVKFIHIEEPIGFGPACNVGLELAKYEDIAIFNNDMLVPSYWYRHLKEALEDDFYLVKDGQYEFLAKIGMVSGALTEPRHVGSKEYWDKTVKWTYNDGCYILTKGGPWLFKREFFNDVGLFDEQFVPGFWEETDLLYRGVKRGWIFLLKLSLHTYHMVNATLRPEHGEKKMHAIYRRNRTKFLQKHGTFVPKWMIELRKGVKRWEMHQ